MGLRKNNLGLLTTGLFLGVLVAAMDGTIVATSMGTIVGELGGLDMFVWVTSAYMIAEMAAMPIFGKLSDMYGRKTFFIFGIVGFVLGSILCGTANSIIELSIYRAIQGISGGALIPIAFTIMIDAAPVESRGKLSGLFGAAFGLASIFGPSLGSVITEYLSWQWIFYINLPIGLVAFVLVAFFYAESHERSQQPVDWLGALSLVGAILCFMFALELGGEMLSWSSLPVLSLLSAFVVLIIIFIIAERKAAEPVIPFALFKNRLFATSNLIAMFAGAAFVSASVFIPIFVQGVLGGSASHAGMVLLPMMLSTVVTSTIGGFLLSKFSYRAIMIPSMLLFTLGMLLLTTLSADSSRWLVTLYLVAAGAGIGFSFSVLGNAVIHSIPANQRGSAQSTLNFLRALGMTVGIAIFGMIQSSSFMNRLQQTAADQSLLPDNIDLAALDTHGLLDPAARALIPEAALNVLTVELSESIALTYGWTIIPSVLAAIFALLMSKEKLLMSSASSATSAHELKTPVTSRS